MSDLLTIERVTAGYSPGRPVLREISLSVKRGEFVGVAGPNGSGKSTLVRVASRSLRPWEGRALLDGRDVWSLGAREFARRTAVVPQETYVPFDLSALETVLLGRHPHAGPLHLENAADENAAIEALDAVGAAGLARRSIREISGGERQRVIVAKALMQEPALLLLDEPTAHLDVAHQMEVLSLVSRLAKERELTVVAVLHDLNLAAAWCQRIVVMHGGQIAADGAPNDVITEPMIAHVWQARMWVKRHPATGRPFLLPAPPPFEPEDPRNGHGLRVHVICGGGSGGPALSALMDAGWSVTCGVVNVGDSDEEMCRAMNIPHVAEAPFCPVSPERASANLRLATEADAVVLTAFCVGPGNLDNLRTALAAMEAGRRVIYLRGTDEQTADFTGGEGAALLAKIRERAAEAASVDELRAKIAERAA